MNMFCLHPRMLHVFNIVATILLVFCSHSTKGSPLFQAMKAKYNQFEELTPESLTNLSSIERTAADFQQTFQSDATEMQRPAAIFSETLAPDDDQFVLRISRRKKRYTLQGGKWRKTNLSYRIGKYPSGISDKHQVDAEIAKAFKVWSDVTFLTFQKKDKGRVDIELRFMEGDHGDGHVFDGPGGRLGHASWPQKGGDVHFDNAENWTINQSSGLNLFLVAAHEIGHALGVGHSDVRTSLMSPFYRKTYDPSFTLDLDDVQAIQALYGRRKSKPLNSTP